MLCPTLQYELRLSQGLLQPSRWYLPHPDLCIITSCTDRKGDKYVKSHLDS